MVARILVVDNSKNIRQLLEFCLRAEGWDVTAVDYEHIDLTALSAVAPDLIILDFNMHDSGRGWQFLQLLKMDDDTSKIPILLTTTLFDLSAEIISYLRTRYIQVVYKPFDLNPFIALVQKTLTSATQTNTLFSSLDPHPILVVEDTEDLREALTTVLSTEGYHVETAENGLIALDAVYKADHSMILLDMVMPVMDGYEFLSVYERQLRPHAPVAILSAEDDLLTPTRPLPPFVIDVLAKPFNIRYLLRLVEKYVRLA